MLRRHDDDRVLEVHRAALAVGQSAVVEDLQQHIEHVQVRLLDLVEQHHAVRATAHRFGELAALLEADVARRGADQARHRVLLLVLRHVDADHRPLVVEQVLRQRPRQLGLADAGRAQEDERADRPMRVLQAAASPQHRVGHRLHRLVLADHALVQFLAQVQQLLHLAFEQLRHRNAGPAADDLGDVLLVDFFLDHACCAWSRWASSSSLALSCFSNSAMLAVLQLGGLAVG